MKDIPISEMTPERLRAELQSSINGNDLLIDQINTLEGTLENTQDDNVEKEGRIKELEAELEKQITLTQSVCPHPSAWGKVCSQCNKELVIQGYANKEQSNE